MHWLDAAYLKFTPRVPLFSRGWGDHDAVTLATVPLLTPHEPEPLQLTWNGALGTAKSPCVMLPAGVDVLSILRLPPVGQPRARVLVPPSWGDEGFSQRKFGFGALVERGFELWLIEGAFFGSRRAGKKLALSTVQEFLLLGYANVLDLRALIGAARADGTPVIVAGYSMAGLLAGQAVSTLPWEIPLVTMAPPDSAAPVFIDGPLSKAVSFEMLGDDGRKRLAEVFTRSQIQVLAPPRSRKRIVIANRRDGIVPPSSMERVAKHWGIEPRWIDSGHLGSYVFHRKVLHAAIASVLDD